MPGAPPTRAGLVQQAEQAGSRVQLAAGLLHATHKLLAQVARSIVSVLSLMLVEVSFKAAGHVQTQGREGLGAQCLECFARHHDDETRAHGFSPKLQAVSLRVTGHRPLLFITAVVNVRASLGS